MVNLNKELRPFPILLFFACLVYAGLRWFAYKDIPGMILGISMAAVFVYLEFKLFWKGKE